MEKRKSVLIVDDDRATRDAVRELLEMLGHDARAAGSGAEAIELFMERRADIVFLDLGLPDMTGHDVALQLRSIDKEDTLTLIAFTGRAGEGDARRSFAAGMDFHLRKPVRMETLRDVISRAS